MNIQMNEPYGIGIRDITSSSNDEFHEERIYVCLDIIDEIHEPFPWHLISFSLVHKCVHSHHTHANDKILELMIRGI
jgi:cytochrome b561